MGGREGRRRSPQGHIKGVKLGNGRRGKPWKARWGGLGQTRPMVCFMNRSLWAQVGRAKITAPYATLTGLSGLCMVSHCLAILWHRSAVTMGWGKSEREKEGEGVTGGVGGR